MAPIVEDYVAATSPDGERRLLHLLGVDPFSEAPFRPYLAGFGGETAGAAVDLGPLLTRPGAALLPAGTARELGVAAGGTLAVTLGGRAARRLDIAVVGLLEPRDERTRRALADLLVVDIATAQELLGRAGRRGRPGRIDRIDLLLPEGVEGERLLARIRDLLPPGAEIQPAAARAESNQEMTRAFRLNLTALSLLALVCGVFLIYNTITFSVVQRRTLLGTLRALGVTRGQVFGLVLGEAAAVAVAGTALGLLAGVLLGQRAGAAGHPDDQRPLLRGRGARHRDRSHGPRSRAPPWASPPPSSPPLAPALEATVAAPRAVLSRSALETRFRRGLPLASGLGVGLLALGALLLALPGGLVPAFGGLFGVIIGFALLAPAATVLLARLLRAPMGALFGVLGRMAAGGVVANALAHRGGRRGPGDRRLGDRGSRGDDPQLPLDRRPLAGRLAARRPLHLGPVAGRRLHRRRHSRPGARRPRRRPPRGRPGAGRPPRRAARRRGKSRSGRPRRPRRA